MSQDRYGFPGSSIGIETVSRQDSSPDMVFGDSSPINFEDSSLTLLFKIKRPVTDNYCFITSNYGFIDVFEDSSRTDVLHCIYTPETKA